MMAVNRRQVMEVVRQIAQEVIRCHREENRQGKQPGKPVILFCPAAVLGQKLLGKQEAQQRPAAVAGHRKGHQGAETNAHIVVDESHHRAEQHDAHKASQPSGQHRHYHLHRLKRHKQQPARGAAAGHKGLHPLLRGQQPRVPGPHRCRDAQHQAKHRHCLKGGPLCTFCHALTPWARQAGRRASCI